MPPSSFYTASLSSPLFSLLKIAHLLSLSLSSFSLSFPSFSPLPSKNSRFLFNPHTLSFSLHSLSRTLSFSLSLSTLSLSSPTFSLYLRAWALTPLAFSKTIGEYFSLYAHTLSYVRVLLFGFNNFVEKCCINNCIGVVSVDCVFVCIWTCICVFGWLL